MLRWVHESKDIAGVAVCAGQVRRHSARGVDGQDVKTGVVNERGKWDSGDDLLRGSDPWHILASTCLHLAQGKPTGNAANKILPVSKQRHTRQEHVSQDAGSSGAPKYGLHRHSEQQSPRRASGDRDRYGTIAGSEARRPDWHANRCGAGGARTRDQWIMSPLL